MTDFNAGEWYPAQWWKPELGSDSAVPGTYEVLESGAVKATFLEGLGRKDFFFPDIEDQRIELLHGNVFGKAVTLIDSLQGRFQGNLGQLCKMDYYPRISLEGLLLEEDELSVSEANLVFHDQQEWSQWRAFFGKKAEEGDFPFPPKLVEYLAPDSLVAVTETGRVSIEDISTVKQGKDFIMKSRCRFNIALNEPTSLKSFMQEWALPLEVMIATASGRVGGIDKFSFTNREWDIAEDSHPSQRWVDVRISSKIRSGEKRKNLSWPDLLFSLSDIDWKSQAPLIFEVIPRWTYVVEQWATLLRPDYRLAVPRFVSAVQAVEALDRILIEDPTGTQLADEVDEVLKAAGWNSKRRRRVKGSLRYEAAPSLENRLRRRADDLGQVMGSLTEDKKWPARVARLRNIVSHGLSGSDDISAIGDAARVGTELLMHLLEGTFLLNLDFSEEATDAILQRRSQFGWRKSTVDKYMHLLPEE